MPVDPSISLGVNGEGSGMANPQPVSAGANPLAMLSNFAETQAKLNQLKLFQAQFSAKRKAGQIMASAPDLDTGLDLIQKDPEIQAFAPDTAWQIASTRAIMVGAQGAGQTQAHDSFSFLAKQFPALIQDPSQAGALVSAAVDLASPATRPAVKKSIDRLMESLNTGLDPDPAKAAQQKIQRLTGWAYANGAGDAVTRILSPTVEEDVGDKKVFGTVAPAQGGIHGEAPGAFTPANALTKGITPTLTDQNAVAFGTPAGGRTVNPPATTGNSLNGGGVLAPKPNPVATGQGSTPGVSALPTTDAGDGTPLFPAGYKIKPPAGPKSVTGGPLNQEKINSDARITAFATKGADQYAAGNQAKGMLAELDTGFDNMQREGGFTQPGAAAGARVQLGNTLNTISGMLGGGPLVSPGAVASAENIAKDTQKLTGTLINQLYGGSHHAAETIGNVSKAIPGIDNTYLGAKLLTALTRAGVNRANTQYEFDNAWQGETHGQLTGADVEFNKLHPAEGYIKPILENFGMTEHGFKSLTALENAVKQKWLTPKQAATIAKTQGFELPGGKE